MSFLITARNARAREWDFTLYEDDGTTALVLSASDDTVRVKIGANDEMPTLDLSSLDDTEVTFTDDTGHCTLMLTEAQVAALGPGCWDVEISVFDGSEGKLKEAAYGVLSISPTMLGAVGGEESSSSGESSESSSLNSSSSSF